MRRSNKKWSKQEKEFKTNMNQLKIKEIKKLADQIENDPNKVERNDQQICKVCFYHKKVALCVMTLYNCGVCDDEILHSNSDVDKLCQRCATMHEACKHCGGEMD